MDIATIDAKEKSPEEFTVEKLVEVESSPPKYLRWLYILDSFGVETRGIERVPNEERELGFAKSKTKEFLKVFGLWFSGCGGLTSMSSYFLPTLVFGLNMKDSLTSGIIGMIIGCLVPAYCSIMGPKSGCRQMVSARFLFGYWGVRLVATFCSIGFVGWSVVNCVLGGQIISSISNNGLDVGIIVISVIALVVSIFGIKILLRFETLFSVPITIANILFYVVVFKKHSSIHDSNKIISEEGFSSLTNTGNWLSFFTIGFSITATWGGNAADYYINFPESVPSWQIFLMTFFGISIPTTFVAVVGTVANTITLSYKPWNDAYNANGAGGIIAASFEPWGNFGKFVVVLLFISLICNNIINNYSIAFDLQLVDKRLAFVPRWVYAFVITIIVLVVSLIGKNHFSTILGNFLPMLGYWISIYIAILLEENLIFRCKALKKLHHVEFGNNDTTNLYNWDSWNRPDLYTHGIAAMVAFACGAIGAVIGMNQVYWQGPIARKIGDFGGDVGFFLCFGFTAIAYPFLRYAELKYFGK